MIKMIYKLLCLISLIYIFDAMSLSALNTKYTITGRVINSTDQKALVGANVRIEGTALGSTAKRDGLYTITNISFGSFHLLISYVGFETRKIGRAHV